MKDSNVIRQKDITIPHNRRKYVMAGILVSVISDLSPDSTLGDVFTMFPIECQNLIMVCLSDWIDRSEHPPKRIIPIDYG